MPEHEATKRPLEPRTEFAFYPDLLSWWMADQWLFSLQRRTKFLLKHVNGHWLVSSPEFVPLLILLGKTLLKLFRVKVLSPSERTI
ncbi:hypothetical protein MTR67_002348 [Solanum verrucosum]|uniref:Uncharacterized protein n=1 Tax=Solanum verrucosum TaxID=315347 RepID=A0AAF0T9B2_SOLVR|nr:hypothetical protein MTR67_002348 [Solanum verrucosum]